MQHNAESVRSVIASVRPRKWESRQFDTITLTQNGDWLNIAAHVNEKWTRFGYHAERDYWKGNTPPPQALLEELAMHGWDVRRDKAPERPVRSATAQERPSREQRESVVTSLPVSGAEQRKSRQTTQKDLPAPSGEKVEIMPGDILVTVHGEDNSTFHVERRLSNGQNELLAESSKWWKGPRTFRQVGAGTTNVEEAPDVTYVRLFGSSSWNSKKKRIAMAGYIIRYYLDRLGIDYSPASRIIGANRGDANTGIDLTGDPTCTYVPAIEAYDEEVVATPEVGDLLWTHTRTLDLMVDDKQGRRRGHAEIAEIKDGHLVLSIYSQNKYDLNILYRDAGMFRIPAPELTVAKVKQYGLPLVQAYYRAIQQRIEATPLETVVQLSQWRQEKDRYDQIHGERERREAAIEQFLAAGHKPKVLDLEAKRLLIQEKEIHPWQNITEGEPLPKGFVIPITVKAATWSRTAPAFYQQLRDELTYKAMLARIPLGYQEAIEENKPGAVDHAYALFNKIRHVLELLAEGGDDVPEILQDAPDIYAICVAVAFYDSERFFSLGHFDAEALLKQTEEVKGREAQQARTRVKKAVSSFRAPLDLDMATAIEVLTQPGRKKNRFLNEMYRRAKVRRWLAGHQIDTSRAFDQADAGVRYWTYKNGVGE